MTGNAESKKKAGKPEIVRYFTAANCVAAPHGTVFVRSTVELRSQVKTHQTAYGKCVFCSWQVVGEQHSIVMNDPRAPRKTDTGQCLNQIWLVSFIFHWQKFRLSQMATHRTSSMTIHVSCKL